MNPYIFLLAGLLAYTSHLQAPARAGLEGLLKEPPTYVGKPIDLDFVDAPLADVVRAIAEVGKFNFVIDPGVSGRVTLHLKGVPWDQALSLVLRTQGLGFEIEEGMLRVGEP